ARRRYVRRLHLGDPVRRRQLRWVLDVEHLTRRGEDPVPDARRRDDQREIELALEPLLDDLHVQRAEEPAAEPVAEREGGLRLVGEGGIVEAKLLEGVAQGFVIGVLDRVEA